MNEKELLQAINQIMDEKVQAMSQMMDEKLAPINNRLEKIENDIEELKENTEVTRVATNTLVAWAEKASVEVKIPLFDKAQ